MYLTFLLYSLLFFKIGGKWIGFSKSVHLLIRFIKWGWNHMPRNLVRLVRWSVNVPGNAWHMVDPQQMLESDLLSLLSCVCLLWGPLCLWHLVSCTCSWMSCWWAHHSLPTPFLKPTVHSLTARGSQWIKSNVSLLESHMGLLGKKKKGFDVFLLLSRFSRVRLCATP